MARIIHNTIWVETGTLQHEGAHRPGQRVIDDEGRQWFPTTPPLALSRTIAGALPHDRWRSTARLGGAQSLKYSATRTEDALMLACTGNSVVFCWFDGERIPK